MIVRLSLIQNGSSIEISPRDEATRLWLANGGVSHISLGGIRERWQMRGVSRRDLPIIAAELQYELRSAFAAYERSGLAGDEPIEFEVRACEYATVEVLQELREID